MRLPARSKHPTAAVLLVVMLILTGTGCRQPADHRHYADSVARDIIAEKQTVALGRSEPFSIERPSDLLRRRLLLDQQLPRAGAASLGADQLPEAPYWPEPNYPYGAAAPTDPCVAPPAVTLSLTDALQVAARNSLSYQSRKEDVFRAALTLDLERNQFRNIFVGTAETLVRNQGSSGTTTSGIVGSGELGVSRQLESGASLSTALAVDLAKLLTMDYGSSMGLAADATIAIPLLRGAGAHIVTEPLTQAERNVIYAIWEFTRFKKEFAVNVAANYLSLLSAQDSLRNAEDDYRSRIASARRSRRLADAGRLEEIQVDQAVQQELGARQRWIAETQRYKRQLDAFKQLLGLPPDSEIALDNAELARLTATADEYIERQLQLVGVGPDTATPPADAPIDLEPPDRTDAGPLELDPNVAVELALASRLDLRTRLGQVFDAQRTVVVAADALGAELTFFGSADLGSRRTINSADLDNARLRTDEGTYSAWLTVDLPFERTAEALSYRNSFISLERAVRDVQALEDDIKLQVRNELRNMLEARESLYIQAQAVLVARKRVRSVNLFLEAGRAQIRDLLEAQDDLLAAQNRLTAAVVDYKIAAWRLQRDMGVLQVDADGLWQEYTPENSVHVQK